jgi:hypothetical protein
MTEQSYPPPTSRCTLAVPEDFQYWPLSAGATEEILCYLRVIAGGSNSGPCDSTAVLSWGVDLHHRGNALTPYWE